MVEKPSPLSRLKTKRSPTERVGLQIVETRQREEQKVRERPRFRLERERYWEPDHVREEDRDQNRDSPVDSTLRGEEYTVGNRKRRE